MTDGCNVDCFVELFKLLTAPNFGSSRADARNPGSEKVEKFFLGAATALQNAQSPVNFVAQNLIRSIEHILLSRVAILLTLRRHTTSRASFNRKKKSFCFPGKLCKFTAAFTTTFADPAPRLTASPHSIPSSCNKMNRLEDAATPVSVSISKLENSSKIF